MIKVGDVSIKNILIATDKVISLDELVDRTAPKGDIKLVSTTIGTYAFCCCPITKVVSDQTTTIEERAFNSCTLLEEVNFPNVITLGNYAFDGCNNLTKAYLPKVKTLNIGVFQSCTNLSEIDVSGVTENISSYAFRYCSSLIELRFPNMTKTLGQAFSGCSNLEAVDLGFCSNLGNSAFGTPKLNTLVLRRTEAPLSALGANGLGESCFKSGGTGGTIYIPKVLYDHLGDGSNLDYKAATNWATYDSYGTITWAKIEGSIWELND